MTGGLYRLANGYISCPEVIPMINGQPNLRACTYVKDVHYKRMTAEIVLAQSSAVDSRRCPNGPGQFDFTQKDGAYKVCETKLT